MTPLDDGIGDTRGRARLCAVAGSIRANPSIPSFNCRRLGVMFAFHPLKI
jgi:hypothetical protein